MPASSPIVAARLLALLTTLALAACEPPDATDPAPAAEATQAGQAAPPPATANGTAAASAASAQIALDLRRPLPEAPNTPAADTQRIVAAVYGDGAPTDVRVAGSAEGAFTEGGHAQTVHLLTRGAPMPGPDGPRPMLAVFEDGRLLTQFVPEAPYDAIAATVDADGDGIDELLLSAGGMQMGQVFRSVHVLSLAGGKRTLRQRHDEAYLDACGNPVGERAVYATVLVKAADGLRADRYRAECRAQGEPQPGDFAPSPAAPAS